MKKLYKCDGQFLSCMLASCSCYYLKRFIENSFFVAFHIFSVLSCNKGCITVAETLRLDNEYTTLAR